MADEVRSARLNAPEAPLEIVVDTMTQERLEGGIAAREALMETLWGCAEDGCSAEVTIEHMQQSIEAWRQSQ